MIDEFKGIEVEIRKYIDTASYEELLDLSTYLYKYGDDIRWMAHLIWEEGL